MRHTDFKQRELFQDVLCCLDYDERLVASFAHKIKPYYYGRNRSVYIEGIELEHFGALPKTDINSTTPSRQLHAVFQSFLYDDRK